MGSRVVVLRADDGIGFSPDDALNKSGHFGLRGIRSRATKLKTDEAPARPPVKKYHGISGCQTGSLITGRP